MADASTFDSFYADTRLRLLRALTAMTADREQAADVLQEAYTKAWLSWDRVGHLDDPEAWVRTVAWRSAVSRWRQWQVSLRAAPRIARAEESHDPDVAAAVTVRAALAQLPPEQRHVLVLHEMCDLSVEQIALEAGIPEGTVKSRLSRGRAALLVLLSPRDLEPPEEVRSGSGA
jgi:RNA polymerase sigma-70 factor (ECF subfamily)